MKLAVIISALTFLLTLSGMNIVAGASQAGAAEEITMDAMAERWRKITIRRDPFLDPSWLKKQREEEQKRKAEEERRKAAERKRQALKLKGIVQVGNQFVAIIDGKTLRAGDIIRGRKILEVSLSGIKVFHKGKVRTILWQSKTTRRLR